MPPPPPDGGTVPSGERPDPAIAPTEAHTPPLAPTVDSGAMAQTQADTPAPPRAVSAALDSGALADEHRYVERGLLGAGGMGEVRTFLDRRIGRDVARKTLLGTLGLDPDARKRFLREVRIQGQIEHPAVVPVYDLFTDEAGALSFTMKRVAGRTLAEILAAKDEETARVFTRRKLLQGLATVCLAIDYAHRRGVVHRDLKPQNLMFGDFGEVYVLDWGVAKLGATGGDIEAPTSSPFYATGIVGTPAYMAPEQLAGGVEEVDGRADVFALGLVLFEILAGRPLRAVRSPLDVLRASDAEDPRPSRVVEGVPPELDAICAKAAARRREDRFPSARALADALERYLDGDRDLERRRALAREHAERAGELRAAGDAKAAMTEVVRALGLDAEEPRALETLRALLLEAPDRLPPEAEVELEELRQKQRTRSFRAALPGWAAMSIPMPFTALLGDVRWSVALACFALMLLSGVAAGALSRLRRIGSGLAVAYFALAGLTTMTASAWLGPFIMLPVTAAVVTTLVCLSCSRSERPWALLIGTLAAVGPVGLELVGLLPRSTLFEPGRVILISRFANVDPTWAFLGLVWTSAAFTPFAGYVAGRLRDTLNEAERRLFAHAWHLRTIVPSRAE